MSATNLKNFARKMFFEEDFFALALRNPDKAMNSFGAGAFDNTEQKAIRDFASSQSSQIAASVDQLGGGGVIDLGNGCGVWC
jgi:hypothetical protein